MGAIDPIPVSGLCSQLTWRHMALRAALCLCAITGPVVAGVQSVQLELDAMSGPGWSVRKVQLALRQGGAARLGLKSLVAQGRDWGDVVIECRRFTMDRGVFDCAEGMLQGAERWPLSFRADPGRKTLQLQVAPVPGEDWRVDVAGTDWRFTFSNVAAARLAPLLSGAVKPSAGQVTGTLRIGADRVDADLMLAGGAFADAAGLRAGENLQGRLALQAARSGAAWAWQSSLHWDKGAVFWEPWYVTLDGTGAGTDAARRLDASGSLADSRVRVQQATLDWPQVGRLAGSIDFGREAFDVGRYAISGKALKLAGLRALLPQVWLDEHRLADLTLTGAADWAIAGSAQGLEQFTLSLAGAGLHAPTRGVEVENLETRFDYRPGNSQPGSQAGSQAGSNAGSQPFHLAVGALRVRDLAIGPIRAEGEIRDGRLFIPNLVAPLLDGVLALAGIEVDQESFQLQGALTPVSMPKLTEALGWHPLGGVLSFVLPRVHYAKSTVAVDGALLFKLFDGDAQVDGIRLDNPFGRTPRFNANLHLKRMNLEAMTGAVKFGAISGFVDVDVDGLVMERWQPVSMDARVLTSEGSFAKRISQRAVQNISSLGGAGAGAAIQRSFLGFFETFGYDKIGLSCKLRNGICEMGGAENAAGGFTLIKGGGLPAVNVVGYNRFVGWQELLDRIQAVIDGNSRPVFQ